MILKTQKLCMEVILITVLCIFLTSCIGPGQNDWSYELPNDYAVWHVNADKINIVYTGNGSADEILSFVNEFAYDDRYVFAKSEKDTSNEICYILDTTERKMVKSFETLDEMVLYCEKHDIEAPDFWYETSADPNTVDK